MWPWMVWERHAIEHACKQGVGMEFVHGRNVILWGRKCDVGMDFWKQGNQGVGMLWGQDAAEHGRNQDVGMGVVRTGCSGAWTESGCARGCGLNGIQSTMDVIRMWMWAKILWSWAAVVHEPNAGWAMNASRIGWSTDLKNHAIFMDALGIGRIRARFIKVWSWMLRESMRFKPGKSMARVRMFFGTGCAAAGTWSGCGHKRRWKGAWTGGNWSGACRWGGMLSMNVTRTWARMLWAQDALEHGHNPDLGMGTGCSRAWT